MRRLARRRSIQGGAGSIGSAGSLIGPSGGPPVWVAGGISAIDNTSHPVSGLASQVLSAHVGRFLLAWVEAQPAVTSVVWQPNGNATGAQAMTAVAGTGAAFDLTLYTLVNPTPGGASARVLVTTSPGNETCVAVGYLVNVNPTDPIVATARIDGQSGSTASRTVACTSKSLIVGVAGYLMNNVAVQGTPNPTSPGLVRHAGTSADRGFGQPDMAVAIGSSPPAGATETHTWSLSQAIVGDGNAGWFCGAVALRGM